MTPHCTPQPDFHIIIVASGEARRDLARLLASLEPQLKACMKSTGAVDEGRPGSAGHAGAEVDHERVWPSLPATTWPSGRRASLRTTAPCVLAQTLSRTTPPAVTVVNNRCTASTIESLAAWPWASIADFGENLGYGRAINRALRGAAPQPRWLIACNADLVFPDGSLAALDDVLSRTDDDVACVAPLLLDAPESGGGVQPSVGAFPTLPRLLLGRLRPRRTRKYLPTPARGTDVDWATGSCLALRRRAFVEVGGFDESMFLDYEETDLCRRLADRGWRRRIEPRWRVIHTSPNAQRPADPQRQIHTRRSLMTYLARHRPAWELRVVGALLRATVALRPAHPMAPSWRAGLETYRHLRAHRAS